MPLFATGLNSWNQLQFEKPSIEEPQDISSFTCVLQDGDIDCIRPFFSYTLVSPVHTKNGNFHLAGMVPKDHQKLRTTNEKAYATFVEAANGVVVVHDKIQTLDQYSSIRNLLANNPTLSSANFPPITQLVAYATGFAALSSDTRQVWTWGDERYTACLGREPTDDSPAEVPNLVVDLEDLPTGPITKIATGGYVLAALTAGNDLYCWGHAGRAPFLPDLSDTPSPVVIDEDKDVADMAIGDEHIVALTTDGAVYVIGDNSNGQLGIPGVASTSTWTRVDLGSVVGKGQSVTGVAAGPRSSFLIVRNQLG